MRKGIDCKGKEYEEINYGNIEDLRGKTFNKLTVLFRVKDEKKRRVLLLCQCECGNLLKVRKSHLKKGETKTCGFCYSFKGEDLSHKIFNNLLVLSFEERKKEVKKAYWKCKCLLCGKIVVVEQNNLKNGTTKSCGCLKEPSSPPQRYYGNWEVLKEWKKMNKKIYWLCQCSCGKEKWVRKDALLEGKSKGCGHDIYSQGSKRIKKILEERKILFTQEYCFPELLSEKKGNLRFDFAIFNEKNILQYLIEYDGEQHFKKGSFGMNDDTFLYRKKCDNKKEEYCKKKNIPLYRIPYYADFNSLEEILTPSFLIKK